MQGMCSWVALDSCWLTEQKREREGVLRRERINGEVDHVSNDRMRVALMRALALQTPEHDVADVDNGVRMAARALMAARSVEWIRSSCGGFGNVGQVQLGDLDSENSARRKSMIANLWRRDLVSPPHPWSN